jgi:hypothetical protein
LPVKANGKITPVDGTPVVIEDQIIENESKLNDDMLRIYVVRKPQINNTTKSFKSVRSGGLIL